MRGKGRATGREVTRQEARQAKKDWLFTGEHIPSHIGFPPTDCADVSAQMGRIAFKLPTQTEALLKRVQPIQTSELEPMVFIVGACLEVDGTGRDA